MSTAIATHEIPKDAATRRHWVIYQLRLRGISVRRLAMKHGVSRQAISAALLLPSSHLERVIAKELGLKVEQLFPERFGPNGERLHLTRAPERSRAPKRRNVQVAGVF